MTAGYKCSNLIGVCYSQYWGQIQYSALARLYFLHEAGCARLIHAMTQQYGTRARARVKGQRVYGVAVNGQSLKIARVNGQSVNFEGQHLDPRSQL